MSVRTNTQTTRLRRKRLLLFGVVLLLLVYALFIEPNWLKITQLTLNADPKADRIRLVILSDLHLHQIGWREEAVVRHVQQLKPDLIILSGDVTDRADTLPVVDALLTRLGNTPKVAVLGNWEYWSALDLPALRQLYQQKHQTQLLINQVGNYQIRSRVLQIVGLDDFTAGNPSLDAIQLQPSASLVVVQHSPGWFEQVQLAKLGRKADVCLAGHTHGGQVTLFGWVLWPPLGSGHFQAGYYPNPHCPLYVTPGIGTSLLPIRFGARPELLVVDL